MELYNIFLFFVAYAFLGWVCESLYVSIGQRKWVNRGFLYSPICPIYGFGALLIMYILNPFVDYPLLIFILGIVVTSLLEYFTSWLMETIFHIRWWDYSTYKYNINGRVCLKNSLMFGVLGLFVVYAIHPLVIDFIDKIPNQFEVTIAIVLAVGIMIDVIISTLGALNIDRALKEIHKTIHEIYETGELTKETLTKNFDALIKKLEKRQEHFKRSFPSFEHLKFNFDRSLLEDFKAKIKAIKIKEK
ncbi:putative membrane protein [Breznakia sp. PF5-3]|uniref:putative ABC transporter permease n=1 Tax=unclassified Breznakia TaxID=2623764 RepID=UPI0024068D38|nr:MULTISPECIES: putative ABC transporter permease [unclassified Breznakia]MDL2276683.1 putative ABC transporter permease [Breznakia sp. OttesenSCG-928-G09]MDF9823939.1 putative membrane protein [Breznakia sp. PM6-1]MDF9834738.1 putative membrane protein [Breznakia sp. PF5-3]MDF9836826.1 putative membrane protein [Breznakia sp. PFB2-8]MDF9858844.1 putative membrane protein [Breznakia sp. PH5-24]